MDILKEFFGSSSRAELVRYFVNYPEQEIQFAELQKKVQINPRQLTLQLQKLKTINFVDEREEGNRKFYCVNTKAKYYQALSSFVQSLEEDDIWRWERAATIHHLYIAAEAAMAPMYEYFGVCWPTVLMIYTGENVLWCCKQRDLLEVGNKIIDWYKQEDNKSKFESDVKGYTENLKKVFDKIENTDLNSLTNQELLDLYYSTYQAYKDWYAILWSTEPASVAFQNYFSQNLELLPEDLSILTALTRESFSQEIEEDFLALVEQASEQGLNFDNPKLKRSVKDFQRKYFWINNNYFESKVLETEEVVLDLKKRINSNRKQPQVTDLSKQKSTIIKKLKLDQETQKLLKVAEDFVYWQDYRKKWIMIFAHYLDLLLKEFAVRVDLDIRDLRAILPQELEDLLGGKKLNLQERRKNCLLVLESGAEHGVLYTGQKAKQVEKKYLTLEQLSDKKTVLKGNVACNGKAIGVAKVLMNPAESFKVNHGDILVTSMTSPDFMQAVRKCVGIVTNEGGITCHASVIARELNIPCVIGTNQATEVIKDGDLVEVDADQGIVNIVK